MISIISLARFYFGELKNYLYFLSSDKRSHLGGVANVHFVCLKCYRSLLPISQSKIVECAWVPSSTEQNQTPAMAARTP